MLFRSKNICSFKTVDSFPKIRDGHLGRIVTGSARAIVVPFAEAECLPATYEGIVNFARVSLEQQIMYGYRQDLKLQMQKSTETYQLSELGEDSVALKILGYGTAKELSEDLKSIYGVEATKGKWRWIGISVHETKWSRNYSDSPFIHPYEIGRAHV